MAGGKYTGTSNCEAAHPVQRPTVPYGNQSNKTNTLWFEEGYKEVIGYLTEGRYLTFEYSGRALTNPGHASHVSITRALADHSDKHQRWVIHYTADEESQIFQISSALDGKWIGDRGALVTAQSKAANIKITFLGNGKGYSLQYEDGSAFRALQRGCKIWSVSYH
jgi:phospholipase C